MLLFESSKGPTRSIDAGAAGVEGVEGGDPATDDRGEWSCFHHVVIVPLMAF